MDKNEHNLAYKLGYQAAQLAMLRHLFAEDSTYLISEKVRQCRTILGLSTNSVPAPVSPPTLEPSNGEDEELDPHPQF